jgi:uncharacterized membrane protein
MPIWDFFAATDLRRVGDIIASILFVIWIAAAVRSGRIFPWSFITTQATTIERSSRPRLYWSIVVIASILVLWTIVSAVLL